MSDMQYIAESARAALALGPVQAVCNVCGSRHTLDTANGTPRRAIRCCHARAGEGIAAVYRAYCEELNVISRLSAGMQRCLAVFAASQDLDSDVRPIGYFEFRNRLARLAAVVGLACAARRRLPINIWRFERRPAYYLCTFAEFDVICPWSDASLWMLAPSAQEANRGIARIYLDGLCDEAFWDTVREPISHAGLDVKSERLITGKYDAAHRMMRMIAAQRPMRGE